MPSAMRYLLFGFLCGLIADWHFEPWYIIVIAVAVGMILAMAFGFLLSEAGNWWGRRQDK